jgi:hypothetical protein
MSTDSGTETYALREAAADAQRMGMWQRAFVWGFCTIAWTIATLLVVLPAPSPLWFRILIGVVLAVIPLISYALARVLRPELTAPRRVPLELRLSGANVEVRFRDGCVASYSWEDPSLRVVVFEARYPNREPVRWLYFNNDSFYQGIRLGPAAYDALSRAVDQSNFSKRLDARVARYPARELTWITYYHVS